MAVLRRPVVPIVSLQLKPPFSVTPIPYFDPWDERTWVNSAELGDFWLRVEENSSGGTNLVLKLLADEVVTRYE